jgi:CHAT domain-containing protein
MGDLKAAEPLLRRALEVRQKARGKDSPEAAESIGQLAQLEQARGNLTEAETLFKEAINIRELKLGREHPLVAESCVVLGDLYFAKADLNRADAYYQRGLGIRQKALGADNVLVADCQQRQASVARARGAFAAAEPLYQQALATREKQLGASHPDVADTLLGLAAVQVGKGQTDAAIPGLTRALQINELLLSSLSGTSNESRVDAFLRSLRAEEDLTYSLLAEKSPSAAVIALAATTALLRKGRSIDEAADTSRALYQGLSPDDQQKLASLRETRTRRADLALSGSGIYPPDIYQKLLKDLQESEEKQQAELLKASATLHQRLNGQESDKVLEQVSKILPNDAGLFELLAYRQYNFHPTEKQPQVGPGPLRYAALVVLPEGKPQAFDLGPGEAIDGAVAELLAALTNADSDWQPVAKKLSELVVKPAGAGISDRARLYVAPDGQLNLVPFAVLSDDKGLLVDHHELSYLTSGRDFLRRPAPTKEAPHSAIALLADPEFAAGMKDAGEAPASSRGMIRGLRLGKVAPLPGTREEVKAIEKLLKKAEVKALYGADATKRALLAIEQPGILHVATHGLFLGDSGHGGDNARGMTLEDDGPSKPAEQAAKPAEPVAKPAEPAAKPAEGARPTAASSTAATAPRSAYSENPLLSSMLVLAGAETASRVLPEKRDPNLGNGLVTALEVASMNLWGTQLVVLSACETGRGDVSSLGQGVYGLRRAVMVAGAETLLTSLWKVDDKATRDLMTKYYQNLLKGQGRGQGMRDAALALRKKKPHPYYWAPFITIGRSAPLSGIGKGKKAAATAAAPADDSDDT